MGALNQEVSAVRIEVFDSVDHADRGAFAGRAAVVIDVLRATSVMVTALCHGAARILPVVDVDRAEALARARMPRPLLGGERGGVKLPGFDLSNSPAEYTADRVAGREIVISTTNGTRAIDLAAGADKLFLACYGNVSAAAEALWARGQDAVILCAGTAGRFSLDDVLCAGALIDALAARGPLALEDVGQACLMCYRGCAGRELEALASCAHAAKLRRIGYGEDIPLCFTKDVFRGVPVWQDGAIRLMENERCEDAEIL